jgi:hypothetical protein
VKRSRSAASVLLGHRRPALRRRAVRAPLLALARVDARHGTLLARYACRSRGWRARRARWSLWSRCAA